MNVIFFAQLVGTGPAIMVVLSLAALGIFTFFFVTYFAHAFLTVVIDTAAGIDEIRWPSESIIDWLTKPIYLLWVILPLLFVPALVLAATGNTTTFAITMLALLWFVSPIMYLSTLAAKSWMALFYGPFLHRWAKFFFAYVLFLVWTAPLTAAGAALLLWAMRSFTGVGVAALLLPPLFLLYSRVLGKYAWYVTTRRLRKAKKMKDVNPAKGLKVEALDPWAEATSETTVANAAKSDADDEEMSTAITELTDLRANVTELHREKLVAAEEESLAEEDEWSPKKKPYGVMTEQAAKDNWTPRPGVPSTDTESYDVNEMNLGAPISLWGYYEEREKKEEELRAKGKAVRQYERPRKPPTLGQAMTQEILGFLGYMQSLRAWIMLSILLGFVLLFANIVVQATGIIQTL